MRKVFLWNVFLNRVDKLQNHVSEDYVLVNADWRFSLSYLIDMYTKEGDDILIISGLTAEDQVQNNLLTFKEEVKRVIEDRNVTVNYEEIMQPSEFKETHACLRFFKTVASKFKEGDRIYYDMTYGMKPYSFAMFIAMAYAAKAAHDISVEQILYVSLYTGSSEDKNEEEPATATLWDLTFLFTLNEIAGNVAPGLKTSSDKVFNYIIGDED